MKAKKKSIIAAALSFSLIAGSFTAMAETQDVNIFTTDFDSYQIGDAGSATAAFTRLPYATDKIVAGWGSTNAASIAGVTKDDAHGTSMELNDWWQTVDINLPTPCKAGDKVLVSFDVLATDVTSTGQLKILGNNGDNFEGTLQVKWDGSQVDYYHNGSVIKEQVMPVGEWSNVAFYIDHENNKCVTYINGKRVCESDLLGEKTPLSSVHFQTEQLDCKMYIDNLEVKHTFKISDETENVVATYSAAKQGGATVYVAAYNNSGVLLDVILQKGVSGRVTMPKVEGAVEYKAFLWDDNNMPLCSAESLQ